MPKKTKRNVKRKRKARPGSLLSKQGKAIEAKLEDIVNKEIAEHRKMTRVEINEFLVSLLPKEQVEKSTKSVEDIDNFEITGGGSVIFTPEVDAKESPKEAPKEVPNTSSEEESDDSEEEEDTADEVTEETDTEEEPVKEVPVAKQIVLKEMTSKGKSVEKEKSIKSNSMSELSKAIQANIGKGVKGVGDVPAKQQIKPKQSAEPAKGKQEQPQAKGK